MPTPGFRRHRRPTLATLIALLAVSLLLPTSVGLVLANGPEVSPPSRADASGTIEPADGFGTAGVTSGTVGIKSSLGYTYEDGSVAIVGEILNLRSLRTRDVLITVTFLDDADQEIGEATSYVYLDQIAKGGVGPFVVFEETAPAGLASYFIDASAGSATTTVVGGILEIEPGPEVLEGGFRYYEGTVTNANTFAVTGARAMITVYGTEDAGDGRVGGEVIEVFAADLGDLAAGASAPYSFGIDDQFDDETLGVTITADAYRTGQPNVYVTAWSNYFDDLPVTTFRRDIVWLAEQGITGGCAPGRYCPTANVTRAQMALFLDRALDLPDTAEDFFTDDEGITGEASINRLAESGITGGCTPTRFCPSNSVTRGQMAAFLDRALDLPSTTTDFFTDDETSTFEASINRVAAAGITGGCGGTKFCPSANVTRGQMAAFLRRALEE